MSNNNSSSGGIGCGGFLFLIFLIMKCTNTIDWSWWWVCSPLIVPFALITLICFIAIILKG